MEKEGLYQNELDKVNVLYNSAVNELHKIYNENNKKFINAPGDLQEILEECPKRQEFLEKYPISLVVIKQDEQVVDSNLELSLYKEKCYRKLYDLPKKLVSNPI